RLESVLRTTVIRVPHQRRVTLVATCLAEALARAVQDAGPARRIHVAGWTATSPPACAGGETTRAAAPASGGSAIDRRQDIHVLIESLVHEPVPRLVHAYHHRPPLMASLVVRRPGARHDEHRVFHAALGTVDHGLQRKRI